jgi:hypothetical protein
MKRNTVVGIALGLMMVASIATRAASAKDDQNPSQAGQSSVYFYDVAASDTHGKGKLMVDLNQHTFVFNGQDFQPSAQITLRARAADSAEFVVFATGKATPSGNLHIAGTWEANGSPAEVLSDTYYQPIYSFFLDNLGGFIAEVACYYSTDGGVTWKESSHSDNFLLDQWGWVELESLGVPEFALVKIHVIVLAGKDRTGSEIFSTLYPPEGCTRHVALYEIKGTTFNPKLNYNGYQ